MPAIQELLSQARSENALPGAVLMRRGVLSDSVVYLDSGCVALGVMGSGGLLQHHLGALEGPCWLDATEAILELPCLMDAVAQSATVFRQLPRAVFRQVLVEHAASALGVLVDVARNHRQQGGLALSRVAKCADSRCAEWLLKHAQPAPAGAACVRLLERKRTIAAQLGIAPETLSRVLRQMRERKLISGAGRDVNLIDVAGLRNLAGA